MITNPERFTQFRDLHLRFVRLMTKTLMQTNLTLPKYALLSQLNLTSRLSMTDASERLLISKPALSNLVKRMEKDGYLRKVPHPSDHRSSLLEILPKGRKSSLKAQDSMLVFAIEMMAKLPPQNQKIIDAFYIQLAQLVDERLLTYRKRVRHETIS